MSSDSNASTGAAGDRILSTDSFVTHISTVPANKGRTVGLFLREKVLASTLAAADKRKPHVVLMVHGGFGPSIVAYDLDYRDYSFMAQLARAGYDVFTMSHTGYGPSPRPLMDDPCNVDAEFQPLLVPHVLKEPTPPRYPWKLVSSRTEWDELETVVSHIRKLRGVDRISLIGWSTGAPRAGGFAALHPEQVDKLVLFGPAPWFPNEAPPAQMPEPGAPTLLQTREFLLDRRWRDHVHCDDQIEDPEVCNAYWRAIMAVDEVGAGWGPERRGHHSGPESHELRLAYESRAHQGTDADAARRVRQLRAASAGVERARGRAPAVHEGAVCIALREFRTRPPSALPRDAGMARQRYRGWCRVR